MTRLLYSSIIHGDAVASDGGDLAVISQSRSISLSSQISSGSHFDLPIPYSAPDIYINGLMQVRDTDFVMDSDCGGFILDTTLVSGDSIMACYPGRNIGTITKDNTTTGYAGNMATAMWQHGVSSGSNGLLTVAVVIRNYTSVTDITYGGVSLTKCVSHSIRTLGAAKAEIWYLQSPSSGSSNINITLRQSDFIQAVAVNWFGVDQTSPISDFNYNYVHSASDVSSVVNGAVGDISMSILGLYSDLSEVKTPYPNQSLLGWATADNAWMCLSSYAQSRPELEMGWTISTPRDMVLACATLRAAE